MGKVHRGVTGNRVMSVEVATVEVLSGEEAKHNPHVASLKTFSFLSSSPIQLNSLKNRSINNLCSLTSSLSLAHADMFAACSLRRVWVAIIVMELILYQSASMVIVTTVCPGPSDPT